jgi:small acid-soluble spore protein D (minor alpha/beta-type SASP)
VESKQQRKVKTMTNNTQNYGTTNQPVNANAQGALNQMKYEIANQLGINLKQGYNGDLTSRQAGSIGGEMVRQMISYAEQNLNNVKPQ